MCTYLVYYRLWRFDARFAAKARWRDSATATPIGLPSAFSGPISRGRKWCRTAGPSPPTCAPPASSPGGRSDPPSEPVPGRAGIPDFRGSRLDRRILHLSPSIRQSRCLLAFKRCKAHDGHPFFASGRLAVFYYGRAAVGGFRVALPACLVRDAPGRRAVGACGVEGGGVSFGRPVPVEDAWALLHKPGRQDLGAACLGRCLASIQRSAAREFFRSLFRAPGLVFRGAAS